MIIKRMSGIELSGRMISKGIIIDKEAVSIFFSFGSMSFFGVSVLHLNTL